MLTLNDNNGNEPIPGAGRAGLVDIMVPSYLVYVVATSAIMALPETLAFISGAVYPKEAQPEFAQRIGEYLPLTYAVDALRSGWTNGIADWPAIGICAAVTVVAIVVALRTFRWEAR